MLGGAALFALAGGARPARAEGWMHWPVARATAMGAPLTQGYYGDYVTYCGSRAGCGTHDGYDYGIGVGTPLYAVAPGVPILWVQPARYGGETYLAAPPSRRSLERLAGSEGQLPALLLPDHLEARLREMAIERQGCVNPQSLHDDEGRRIDDTQLGHVPALE